MPADFSKIKNPKIAELLKALPYFDILSEKAKQDFIDKIAQMPEEKLPTTIQILEKQVATLPKLTDKEKIAIIEGETEALQSLTKSFKQEALATGEKIEKEESQKTQNQLLKELDNL